MGVVVFISTTDGTRAEIMFMGEIMYERFINIVVKNRTFLKLSLK